MLQRTDELTDAKNVYWGIKVYSYCEIYQLSVHPHM